MEEVIINFGTAPGHDVSSYSGTVICECFAATSVKSNEKLKKDILRLHGNPTAKERLVFYYSHNADAERSYIEKLANQYKDVALWSIPFDALMPLAHAPVMPRLVPAPSPAKKTDSATWK